MSEGLKIDTKEIDCKMCKKKTKHIEIWGDGSMWKCMRCGEYNKPKGDNDV